MIESRELSEFYNSLLKRLGTMSGSNHKELQMFPGLYGKRILITGSAGSIGSELAKKIICFKPESVGLLDINESELHDLKLEINENSDCTVKIFLCDVSRRDNLKKVFKEFQPELVYHTAAYKHIPILENFPEEALRVNVIGTYNSATLSGELNVQKFIFVSTDKAVNPISKMGKSKNIAEALIHKIRKNYTTDFIVVRFCNVIGSRGSVSEIFIKQILKGGPVTLTHPDMERYFITIDQAVRLTLEASESGRDGSLYIPQMNKPVKIAELLQELINKFNPVRESHIEIVLTGSRKGERLTEELITSEENKYISYEGGFCKIDTDYLDKNFTDCVEEFSEYKSYEFERIKNKLIPDNLVSNYLLREL